MIEEAVRNQHLRMSGIPNQKRTKSQITTITVEDLKNIPLAQVIDSKAIGGIGFKMNGN